MPVLKDQRQELFAQQIASGAKPATAAQVAGCKEVSAPSQASRWLKNANISQRIAELRNVVTERAIEKAAVDKAAVLAELAKLGFANMQDYMTVGEDGAPSLNWKDLTRDQAAALVEVTVDENKIGDVPAGKKIKFKLADKQTALVNIGKELGMFIDKKKEPPTTPLKDLTDEQLDQLITRLSSELSAEELAKFGLERTRRAETGEQARPLQTVPKAG